MQSATESTSALLSSPSALTGNWKLEAGRAITLVPPRGGELRILSGRAWVTLDGPHAHREGDLFLEAGQSLLLVAGQRAVVEPWGGAGDPALGFDWVAARAAGAAGAIVQPLADLRLALASGAYAARAVVLALGRLALGLAAWTAGRLPRPRGSGRIALLS